MPLRVSTLETIVFDFDGTLAVLNIDFKMMRQTVLDHLATYDVPTETFENLYVLEMVAQGGKAVADRLPGTEDRYLREAGQLVREIEIKAAKAGRLIPGTREMLHELRRRQMKVGVITRNCRAALELLFPDIERTVDIVLTRDHFVRVKPDPEHLRYALSNMHTPPDHSAMVGDHPMDIKLGRDVGAMAIGVLTGFSGREDLIAAGAHVILEKAADILSLLK